MKKNPLLSFNDFSRSFVEICPTSFRQAKDKHLKAQDKKYSEFKIVFLPS